MDASAALELFEELDEAGGPVEEESGDSDSELDSDGDLLSSEEEERLNNDFFADPRSADSSEK